MIIKLNNQKLKIYWRYNYKLVTKSSITKLGTYYFKQNIIDNCTCYIQDLETKHDFKAGIYYISNPHSYSKSECRKQSLKLAVRDFLKEDRELIWNSYFLIHN